MRQILQNVRHGQLAIEHVPEPAVRPLHVKIANRCSIISPGTERMARQLAQKSLLAKARERPDHVRRVVEKARTEGILSTLVQVRARLDEPMPLGYSSSGVVLACGSGVEDLKPGDRVASNGPHAETVCVPRNLCAAVPAGVESDQAAFAVLGAIALQGLRISRLALGESALVIGLGLVGQITVGLLKSAGIRVIATDLDHARCQTALAMGAEEAQPNLSPDGVLAFTGGVGADAVLITASTSSDGPVTLAGQAVRKKGRVVVVGAVGMKLPRRPYYFKEAEFVVSCSYGPGRYDPDYEEGGRDYPIAYARWTEQRNMQAVLELLARRSLDLSPLISHRFAIDQAVEAYQLIETNNEPSLAVLLEYPAYQERPQSSSLEIRAVRVQAGEIGIGCLGAGSFARSVLLPKLVSLPGVRSQVICSAGGRSAAHAAAKFGFAAATSDERDVLQHPDLEAVFVLTQHDQHARQVLDALDAGKHVFVEKPLCLTAEELMQIEAQLKARSADGLLVMVGFNRRFSPAALAVRKRLASDPGPKTVSVRFNAGSIPAEHWTQDPQIGGGRIVGEACHAIDLATFLVGAPVIRVFAESVGGPNAPEITDDQCFITLRHADGSVSNVAYLAGGDRALPKERVEVFGGGQVALIDDFRSATVWNGGRRRRLWRGRQDKGHAAELQTFIHAIRHGGQLPIPWTEIRATSLAAMMAVRSLREGVPVELRDDIAGGQPDSTGVLKAG